MTTNQLEIVNKLKAALSLSVILCLNSINGAYQPLPESQLGTMSGYVDPALFRSVAMPSKTLAIPFLGATQHEMLSNAASKFLRAHRGAESELMRDVNESLLSLKRGVEPFNVDMQNFVLKYGDRVFELSIPDQITYGVARAIESFFAGDLVLTASFCLHARQLSLLARHGVAPLSDLATSFIMIRAHHEPLTPDDRLEALLFRLHLGKLSSSHQSSARDIGTILSDPQQLLKFSDRNPSLHGHTVYLTAQLACASRRANPEPFIAMVEGNYGFFTAPEQKDSFYREGGQRLYVAALAMRLSSPDQHVLRDLIEFTRTAPSWDSTLKIPGALDILGKLFVRHGDGIAPEERGAIIAYYTSGPSGTPRYSEMELATLRDAVIKKTADTEVQ